MYFSRNTLITLLASPLLALAQSSANPFNIPTSGLSATAGTPLTLNWKPTTSGTISLILRSGASSSLAAGTYIAQGVTNSGSYQWTPSMMITRGSDYTVEIVDDTDSTNTNYTPYFVIDSTNTVAYSTSDISEGVPTATPTVSTASNTNSATASSMTASSASASMSSASAATMTSSGSMTGSMSSTTGSMTGSSSSGMSTSASSSGAAFQSSMSSASASASASVSAQSTNGAPRATAAAGLMGLIALGALAL